MGVDKSQLEERSTGPISDRPTTAFDRSVLDRSSIERRAEEQFGTQVPYEELEEGELYALEMVGRMVGEHYRLERVIGVGGMAAVFETLDMQTGRMVALKSLLPRFCQNKSVSMRFMREAESASRIGHPNIVKVLDSGVVKDDHFLVLELLRGRDLGEAMDADDLTLGDIWQVAIEVLDGLAAAHLQNIVHRDIKPENVYLQRRGRGFQVKLLDFGIAKHKGETSVQEKLTQTGTVLGTPHYMSPEQARGISIDHRTDIWAIGAMLFRLLCGFPPFDADNYNVLISRVLTELPPKMGDVRPELPSLFRQAVDGALRPEVDQRWPTAREMQRVLAHGKDISAVRRGHTVPCSFPWALLHRSASTAESSDEILPEFDDQPTQASYTPYMDDVTVPEASENRSAAPLEYARTVRADMSTLREEHDRLLGGGAMPPATTPASTPEPAVQVDMNAVAPPASSWQGPKVPAPIPNLTPPSNETTARLPSVSPPKSAPGMGLLVIVFGLVTLLLGVALGIALSG